MSLSHLTAVHLRKAAKLVKKKEGFLAKVGQIERELEALALYGVLPKTYEAAQRREARSAAKRRAKSAPRTKPKTRAA